MSYDDKVIKDLGPYELYDDYNKKYKLLEKPAIMEYNKSFWVEKGSK